MSIRERLELADGSGYVGALGEVALGRKERWECPVHKHNESLESMLMLSRASALALAPVLAPVLF